MTKEEAIKQLKNIRRVPSMFIDEAIKDLVKAFQQPPTLAEMLGWEEKQEYEWRGNIFRINSDILQVWDREDEMWFDSSEELNDYLRLRQAKKVKPKYLLQTDLVSENGIQYLSLDKNRRKYFLGALMANENVQQSFTDDEITKINTITRFAKLCEKIQVG